MSQQTARRQDKVAEKLAIRRSSRELEQQVVNNSCS